MVSSAEEKMYSVNIAKPKPGWVSDDEWGFANMSYQRVVTQFLNWKRGGCEVPYFEKWFNSIEVIVTSEDLEGIWKTPERKKEESPVGHLDSIFLSYYVGKPQISLAERNEVIMKIQEKFKEITSLLKLDISIRQYFDAAYGKAFTSCSNLRKFPNRVAFMEALEGALSDVGLNTHAGYPLRKHKEGNKAEKIFFINRVSMMVNQFYKKPNHVMASKVLNKIRPDLGSFNSNLVSKAVNASDLKGFPYPYLKNKEHSKEK